MRFYITFLAILLLFKAYGQKILIYNTLDDSITCNHICIKSTNLNGKEALGFHNHEPWSEHSHAYTYLIKEEKCHSGEYCLSFYNSKKFSYLQAVFNCPLIKDSLYYFDAYLLADSRSFDFNSCFGIKFSDTTIKFDNSIFLKLNMSADIMMEMSSVLNSNHWTKFEAYYKANGNEKAMILGCFEDKKVKYQKNKNKNKNLYSTVFIDDILFKEMFDSDDYCDSIFHEQKNPSVSITAKPQLLSTVYFDNNQVSANHALDSVISFVTQAEDVVRILVVGHTDKEGSEAYNLELSHKRAQYIADMLSNYIGREIIAEGRGYFEPVTDTDLSKNRRVEVYIVRERSE